MVRMSNLFAFVGMAYILFTSLLATAALVYLVKVGLDHVTGKHDPILTYNNPYTYMKPEMKVTIPDSDYSDAQN